MSDEPTKKGPGGPEKKRPARPKKPAGAEGTGKQPAARRRRSAGADGSGAAGIPDGVAPSGTPAAAPKPARKDPYEHIEDIADASGRYDPKALLFVLASLEHCRRRLSREGHVTGPELLESFRQLALDQYGPAAKLVLNGWGLETTEDVGRIVFLMVEHEFLSKTEKDRIEDFQDVFDFEAEFVENYRF